MTLALIVGFGETMVLPRSYFLLSQQIVIALDRPPSLYRSFILLYNDDGLWSQVFPLDATCRFPAIVVYYFTILFVFF